MTWEGVTDNAQLIHFLQRDENFELVKETLFQEEEAV